MYVYCSNESPVDVFFDNLQVMHTRGALLEETHYYPFGLTMAGISSKAASFGNQENKYKYNGIEHNTAFDLNTYDAFYRNLDPQIGRFWQIDPEADNLESYSPYESMGNNPISNVDPLGDFKNWFGAAWHSLWNGGDVGKNTYGEYYVSKQSSSSSEDGGVTVTVSVTYGKGRHRATALGERLLAQAEDKQFVDNMVRLGAFERHETVEEANEATFKNSVGMLLPNVIKGVTGAVNATKEVRFTQSAADDLVVALKKQFGGNVTVMKDGKPVFRVHQPGTHGNTNATVTKFSKHSNASGVAFPRPDPKVSAFDQNTFDILKQASGGQGGYSLQTKGGR